MNRSAFRPAPRKPRRRRAGDPLKVDAAIEGSRQYQRLLRRAAAMSQDFQKQLNATQLHAWLSLEEALLELATHGNQEYFKAGVAIGRQQRRGGRDAGASCRTRRDPELAETLVQLIRIIARQ
jgi:hypothetical protein